MRERNTNCKKNSGMITGNTRQRWDTMAKPVQTQYKPLYRPRIFISLYLCVSCRKITGKLKTFTQFQREDEYPGYAIGSKAWLFPSFCTSHILFWYNMIIFNAMCITLSKHYYCITMFYYMAQWHFWHYPIPTIPSNFFWTTSLESTSPACVSYITMILLSDIITVPWFCQKYCFVRSTLSRSLFQTVRVRDVATLTDVCGLGWGVCSSEEDCSDEELMLLQGRRHQRERDTRTANRWGQRQRERCLILVTHEPILFSMGWFWIFFIHKYIHLYNLCIYNNSIIFISVSLFLIRRGELFTETGHHTSKLQHRNR